MKPITIKDIAKEANVSIAAVSLVLNNKPSRISEGKKQEIKDIAVRLNYQPNLNAKGLASNKTTTIGLLIPDIENPFFASLAKALESNLKANRYSMILTNTDDKFENDVEAIKNLNNKGVDGFLLILSNESYKKKDDITNILNRLNKPFVLIDRTFNDISYNQVSYDNFLGQYLATEFLIKQGYKDISYIAPPLDSFTVESRVNGFKQALSDNNIVLKDNMIVHGNYRFSSGYELTEQLLRQGSKAIVVSNDMMAYGTIKKINELNKDIPNDVAVVGYDDLIYSNMSLVSLTTVRQDYTILAEESIKLLIKLLKNKEEESFVQIVLEPILIIRNSTL